MIEREPVEIEVRQTSPPDAPRLEVRCTGTPARQDLTVIRPQVERLLGTGINLEEFYRRAARRGPLKALAERFCGLKPPRFPTVFECLVNAMACQQVTLSLGIHLLNRLTERYGMPRTTRSAHAFPRPGDLANLDPQDLRALGFSRQKARAIVELSRAVVTGGLELEGLEALNDAAALARLRSLRGVGRWTAEYVLLRGLGRLHIFPGDDAGARRNLQRWLGRQRPLDYESARQAAARWAPYSGLIYFHLLPNHLVEAKVVSTAAQGVAPAGRCRPSYATARRARCQVGQCGIPNLGARRTFVRILDTCTRCPPKALGCAQSVTVCLMRPADV